MKRKHYNLLATLLFIIALALIMGFHNPYSIGLGWNFYAAILLAIAGFIIMYAANKCPYCDRQIPSGIIKPAEYCPYCGSDISDL